MKFLLLTGAVAMPAVVAGISPLAGVDSSTNAGKRAFQKCYACHSLEAGEAVDGPDLAAIVGAPVARRSEFDYSPALARFAKTNPAWTENLLDRFIEDPEALVPGTTMAFAGVRDPAERAALIEYLKRHAPGDP